MVAKGTHTAAQLVDEELEVVEDRAAAGKAGEDLFPAALVLVAVGKGNVVISQGKAVLGDLLEAEDQGAGGGIGPAAGGDEGRSGRLVLGVVEDAAEIGVRGGALDRDGVAGVDERADDSGGKGPVLEGLLLRPEEDGGMSLAHVVARPPEKAVCGINGGLTTGIRRPASWVG